MFGGLRGYQPVGVLSFADWVVTELDKWMIGADSGNFWAAPRIMPMHGIKRSRVCGS